MPEPALHLQHSPFCQSFCPGSQFFPPDSDFLLLVLGWEDSFTFWPGNLGLVAISVDAVAVSDDVS